MAMIGKVKRMYFREKKSVREIVRLTSLSRNTVRKWLKTAVLEEPKYRRVNAGQDPPLSDGEDADSVLSFHARAARCIASRATDR